MPHFSFSRPFFFLILGLALCLSPGCASVNEFMKSVLPKKDAAKQTAEASGEDKKAEPPQAKQEPKTPEPENDVRFELKLQGVEIGVPMNAYGENLAVVPAMDGHKCLGLNGVDDSEAFFPGKNLKNFEVTAKIDYNFPIHEGGSVASDLMSLRLSKNAVRTLSVNITQGEAEPPMARFSLGGPKLAPDMYCSDKPVRWKEDMRDAVTALTVRKEAGSIRVAYDGEFVCSSPLDPTLVLRQFSTPLTSQTLVYDMTLTELASAEPESPPDKKAALVATEDVGGPTLPPADTPEEAGLTRINVSKLSVGTPVGKFGGNLIVLGDEEGKYIATTSPQGSNVILEPATGADFSVDILIKNDFPMGDRQGVVGRFFLFTLRYANGVSETYALNLTKDAQLVWQSRYFITRSGPNVQSWAAGTDWRPWNNSLDFNEYKVIKTGKLVRFFFNGQFIRNEQSKGDSLVSVKAPLRENERLYDIVVKDLSQSGKGAEQDLNAASLAKETKAQAAPKETELKETEAASKDGAAGAAQAAPDASPASQAAADQDAAAPSPGDQAPTETSGAATAPSGDAPAPGASRSEQP